ncbi:hypothetical protein [Haliangium ochraceum]|uniref:Uncharacterized protein n=1 Tax=Haliangium ochraceum (strain DSM 14365 / JCM 11303 / SMP-2) TaxID=502025 RepID=D0LR30_HALO1|nr:hypothetical protein [Haliangium ochraceum]ACY15538.1 hypothetical protein Hoch_3032 [Haliangium ochraceum DSM 14365]
MSSDTQPDTVREKAADAALQFRMRGRYGSVDKAIDALARRKGLGEVERAALERALRDALAVMDAAQAFAAQQPTRPYLTAEQIPAALDALEAYLRERLPDAPPEAIARARTWLYFAHAH